MNENEKRIEFIETIETIQESRIKKSYLNASINLIFFFITLFLSFFSRKIFLDTLGASFVGFTSTLQNLLGFLNLAELGISSAIGYVLYKPLFEHDRTQINEIISVMAYLYRWIGSIILILGIVMSCFLPYIFPPEKTGFPLMLVYFTFYSFLASSLIGYFINYRQNLLGADQKEYVVTAYYQTANIAKILIQLTLAYYTQNYFLWVTIELCYGIIYSFILNWRINKTYPWLRSEVKHGKFLLRKYPEVVKYTKQLFVHKIAGFAQNQMSPIIIYTCLSLQMVTYYGNYMILFDKISIMLGKLLDSTSASVGNMIAEGNKVKIKHVYWELNAIRYFFAVIIFFSVVKFLPAFITLWLGPEYVLPESVLLLLAFCQFISLTRGTNDQFIFGYGLFYDVWAPLAESIIGLTVSFIAGWYYGLIGVILGNALSRFFIIVLWKSYFLYSKGFKSSYLRYWLNISIYLSLAVLTYILVECIISRISYCNSSINSYGKLIVVGVIYVIIASLIYYMLLYSIGPGMKTVSRRIFMLLKQKINI